MKTQTRSLLPLFCAAATSLLIVGSAAQATPYVVTLQQVGSNVVATGTGAIDLTGLMMGSGLSSQSAIVPAVAHIVTGFPNSGANYGGSGVITGPSSFGSGGPMFASSGTGDLVGFETNTGSFGNFIIVPVGYASGSALSDSAMYNNATFASLGVTPGIYEWTWGTGANQNFTLDAVAPAGAPDSGSTFALLLLSLATLFGARRFHSFRLA
jgi:VPDSG-CTERM motif